MHLTEVVFKILTDSFPPSALTIQYPDLRAILVPISYERSTKTYRYYLVLKGGSEGVAHLLKSLPSSYDSITILEEREGESLVLAEAGVETLRRTNNPAIFVHDQFGENLVPCPGYIQGGFYHVRVITPLKVDLPRLLRTYEEGYSQGVWKEFRLLRMEEFDPDHFVLGGFAEGLTPKQLGVIKTALALGFYDTPRKADLDDLSRIFGVSRAAIHNRLQAAERKVIQRFFT